MDRTYLLFILFTVTLFLSSCGKGRSIVDPDAHLSKYSYATVYQAEKAGFEELELMNIFRTRGFSIIGSGEIVENKTIGVRYLYENDGEYYSITCTIIDATTKKTLASLEGKGGKFNLWTGHVHSNKEKAKEQLLAELDKVVPKISADNNH